MKRGQGDESKQHKNATKGRKRRGWKGMKEETMAKRDKEQKRAMRDRGNEENRKGCRAEERMRERK